MVATVATTDRKVPPASVPQLRQRRRQEQLRIRRSKTLLLRRQTKCKDDGFDDDDVCKYHTASRSWNNHNGRMILTMKNTSTPMSIIVLMQLLLWMVTIQQSVVVVDAANLGLAHAAAANGNDDDGSPAPVYFTVGLFLGIGVTACLMHYCYWRPKDRSRRNEWSLDGNSNDNKTVVGDIDDDDLEEDRDMVRRRRSSTEISPSRRPTTITTLDVIPEGIHENPSLEIPSGVDNVDNNDNAYVNDNDNANQSDKIPFGADYDNNDNDNIDNDNANQTAATPNNDDHGTNVDDIVNAATDDIEDVNHAGNNNEGDDEQ